MQQYRKEAKDIIFLQEFRGKKYVLSCKDFNPDLIQVEGIFSRYGKRPKINEAKIFLNETKKWATQEIFSHYKKIHAPWEASEAKNDATEHLNSISYQFHWIYQPLVPIDEAKCLLAAIRNVSEKGSFVIQDFRIDYSDKVPHVEFPNELNTSLPITDRVSGN